MRVGFRLAHSARVTLTIETASGARVRTITRRLGGDRSRSAGTAATATASAPSRAVRCAHQHVECIRPLRARATLPRASRSALGTSPAPRQIVTSAPLTFGEAGGSSVAIAGPKGKEALLSPRPCPLSCGPKVIPRPSHSRLTDLRHARCGGVTSGPPRPGGESAPTVSGPFVYPAVKPLVFTGSLASLPIAQPGLSWDLPIGFPRAPQLLPPGGGSVGPTRHPQGAAGASHTDSPAIDFSNVYPNFNGAFDLCCPGGPERRRRAEPLHPDGQQLVPDLQQGRDVARRPVPDQHDLGGGR